MERLAVSARAGWQKRMEKIGFLFHTIDGAMYWNETACYRFTAKQVDELEAATNDLHGMSLEAVEKVVKEDLYERFRIPREFAELVEVSWRNRDPTLYGRFDFTYDGHQPPKMLEYNADTPTALFESSVAQWHWLQDYDASKDQFNSIHERLIAAWKKIRGLLPVNELVHFACLKENLEDYCTVEYLRDTANQSGLTTEPLFIEDLGYNSESNEFVDAHDRSIGTLFKLYPYEWMLKERFGPHLNDMTTRLLEPPWKMVLSNKVLLVLLNEMFPRHPNLLPTYETPEAFRSDAYVKKPIYSREGANITIVEGKNIESSDGNYGGEGYVYQLCRPLPSFDGHHAVIGSWVISGQSAGIGIREDSSRITRNTSRFVPHFFD